MGLNMVGLWTVVLGLPVAINAFKDCSAPLIPNGFFISEQSTLSHDTELYYSCNDKFKPVEGSWWASVTCQNGNWSSLPQCIENTACTDPEIPNANLTALQYVKSDTKMRIKCNTGYQDAKNLAIAMCLNGNWTALPVCERMPSSCGPPPPIPNGIIINQVYKEVFPEGAKLNYVCKIGFELETSSNETICIYGEWFPTPSCRPKETNEEQVPLVTTAPVINSGSNNNFPPKYTTSNNCGPPPVVKEGVAEFDEDNMLLTYTCPHLYKLSGDSIVKCVNGRWTPPPTCEVDFCKLDTSKYPKLVQDGYVYIKSETEKMLHCKDSTRASAECIDNELYLTKCCRKWRHNLGVCSYV